MNTTHSLKLYRNGINNIDHQILKLLSQREKLSINIVLEKIKNKINIYDPIREKELFSILEKKSNLYKLDPIFIKKLFLIIIQNSVLLQKKFKTEIKKKKKICKLLGPEGSYSHIAFNKLLISNTENLIPKFYKSFSEINTSLQEKKNFLLLPLENNITGIISEVYQLLKKKKLYIKKEIYLEIKHYLLSYQNLSFHKIQHIYSHKQPFLQCSKFLKNFPTWKKYFCNSTSEAIKKTFKKKNSVVLGNYLGKNLYNLFTLSKNISNQKKNITRFVFVTSKKPYFFLKKKFKITIMFQLYNYKHKINKILNILSQYKCIVLKLLSNLQNKNILKKIFLLDLQTFQINLDVKKIFSKIKKITHSFQILGTSKIN
ncbi:prephenate dehydratase domain-containing protein [Buchnera aphidicola]|uniref:prephenate dehydratase domain-containing protein n=1 Tax=Buchnera aphidicola TaxID=9 RepID=UPI0031B6FFC1